MDSTIKEMDLHNIYVYMYTTFGKFGTLRKDQINIGIEEGGKRQRKDR